MHPYIHTSAYKWSFNLDIINHHLHLIETTQNIWYRYFDNPKDFEPEDSLSECDLYEFECDYSRCIPIEKKCDGYPDCDDETDEIDCPPFTGKQFDQDFF